jgi:hypothetical protein
LYCIMMCNWSIPHPGNVDTSIMQWL